MIKHQAVWDASHHALNMDEMDDSHREFISRVATLITVLCLIDVATGLSEAFPKRVMDNH